MAKFVKSLSLIGAKYLAARNKTGSTIATRKLPLRRHLSESSQDPEQIKWIIKGTCGG